MVTYNWGIANLERETDSGYVYTVHWTLGASDGTYSASSYGSIGLQRPEGDLIPYEDLDKVTVIGWVEQHFGEEKVAEMKAALDSQIAELAAPSKASGTPWS